MEQISKAALQKQMGELLAGQAEARTQREEVRRRREALEREGTSLAEASGGKEPAVTPAPEPVSVPGAKRMIPKPAAPAPQNQAPHTPPAPKAPEALQPRFTFDKTRGWVKGNLNKLKAATIDKPISGIKSAKSKLSEKFSKEKKPEPVKPEEEAPAPRAATPEEMTNEQARADYFLLRKLYLNSKSKNIDAALLEASERIYRNSKKLIVQELLAKGEAGKIEAREFLLTEVELKRKNDLENKLVGWTERQKAGLSKVIERWDNWGKGLGWENYAKRVAKTSVSIAVTGVVSLVSVQGLASLGTNLATRVGLGTAIAAGMEKIPDKKKKWVLPVLLAGGAAVTIVTLGTGGVGVVAASAVGMVASKLVKQHVEKKKEEIRKTKKEINFDNVTDFNTEGIEKEIEKALKKEENAVIWGKLAEMGTAMIVSTAVLEASSLAHHHNQQATENNTGNDTNHNQQDAIDKHNAEIAKHDAEVKAQHDAEVKAEQDALAKHGPDNSSAHTDAIKDIRVVHQGEGIEHTFIRQIEHDPAKFGFSGDANDSHAVHAFAQRQSDVIAREHGYVDSSGHEVRISVADKASFELKTDGHGHVTGVEEKFDGKLIETHHPGDTFENEKVEKEYEYRGTTHHEPVHGSQAVHDVEKTPTIEHQTENSAAIRYEGDHASADTSHIDAASPEEKGTLVAGSAPESTPKDAQADTGAKTTTPEADSAHRHSPTAEEMKGKIETQIDLLKKHPELEGSPFIKNPPSGIPREQLPEIHKVYQDNIIKVSHGDPDTRAWLYEKESPATNFLGGELKEGDNMVPYLNELKKISGLSPNNDVVHKETIEEYVVRIHEWAAKNGKLNELKNIHLEK